MSGEAYERFNEACPPVAPPSVICAACLQSAHTWRPDGGGCQCSCHKDAGAGTPAATSPGHAASVTPGQAAFEVAQGRLSLRNRLTWEALKHTHRAWWEAEAWAAIRAVITVERLAEVLTDRRILVDGDILEPQPGGVWLTVPARPGDLAVQLLNAIDTRLTDDPPPGSSPDGGGGRDGA